MIFKKISTFFFIIFIVTGQFLWPYIKILIFIPFAITVLSFYDPGALIIRIIREAAGNLVILVLQAVVVIYFAFSIFWGLRHHKLEQAIKGILESLMLVFANLLALVFISGNLITEIISQKLKDQIELMISIFLQILPPGVSWGMMFFLLIMGYNLLLMGNHFLFTREWFDKKENKIGKVTFWLTVMFIFVSPLIIFYLEYLAQSYQDFKYIFYFTSAFLTLLALRAFFLTVLKTLLVHKRYVLG